MHPCTSFLLVTKDSPNAKIAANTIRQYLTEQGCTAHIALAGHTFFPEHTSTALHAVLVLGGDGTFIGTVRALLSQKIHAPLLGINFGSVGFLAEASKTGWLEILTQLVQGALTISPRTAVRFALERDGSIIEQGLAVNDITVSRGALARVLTLSVSVDEHDMGQVRSDGLIVSTPVGSSGYAVSAGGALVHPALAALSLTAISPFLCHFPPLTLPETTQITLSVGSPEAGLTIDGQDGIQLEKNDTLYLSGQKNAYQLFEPHQSTYYERLLRCGFFYNRASHTIKE